MAVELSAVAITKRAGRNYRRVNSASSERVSTDFGIGMPVMKRAGTAGRPSSLKRDAIFASRLYRRVIHVGEPLKRCFE